MTQASATQGHTFYNDYGPSLAGSDRARYAAAERLHGLGRLDEADALLRLLIRKRPDFYGSFLALGRNLVRQNRAAEAQSALARALRLRPSCAEASMLMARLLRTTPRWREAARIYEKLAAGPRGLGLARLELGRLQRERGLLTQAHRSICAACESPDVRLEALVERIPLDLVHGRFEAAFQDGEELLSQRVQRELFIDKLLFPFGELARPPFTTERLKRVRKQLEVFCLAQPDNAWGRCLSLALAMMLDDDFEPEAYIRGLDRLAAGRYAWMRSLIGAVHQRREQWRKAMPQFAAVVRAYPRFLRPKFLIGDGFLGLGRPEEALSIFRSAKPTAAVEVGRWREWMGEIHLRLGRYDEALGFLEKSCSDADRDSLAFTWRGAAKQRLGRLDEALVDFDESIRRVGGDIEAYNWRAENMRLRGRHAEALQDADRALKIFPGDICAHMTRALVHADLKRFASMRKDHDAVAEELLSRWGRVLAKAKIEPGNSPERMRAFLTGSLELLENWLRAHDLMPEPLALRLLADGAFGRRAL